MTKSAQTSSPGASSAEKTTEIGHFVLQKKSRFLPGWTSVVMKNCLPSIICTGRRSTTSNNSRLAESDVFQRRSPPLPSAAEHVFAAFSMSAHASLSCAYYSAASSRWINTCWKYYGQDICMWPKSLTSAPPCKQVSAKTLLNKLASHGTICVFAKADLWKFCPLVSGKMMLFLNCCPFFHFNTPNPVSLNFIGLYRITHLALFFSNIIFKKKKF